MKTTTAFLSVGILLAGLGTIQPLPAHAQSGQAQPEILLEEGTKKILRAFELFIMTIPQYEMPEVLPNGDIILRRKNPPSSGNVNPAPKANPSGNAETKT